MAVRRPEGEVDVACFPHVGAKTVTVPLKQGTTMAWITQKLPLSTTAGRMWNERLLLPSMGLSWQEAGAALASRAQETVSHLHATTLVALLFFFENKPHAASLHGVEQTTCASGCGGHSQPHHRQLRGKSSSSSTTERSKRTET